MLLKHIKIVYNGQEINMKNILLMILNNYFILIHLILKLKMDNHFGDYLKDHLMKYNMILLMKLLCNLFQH